MHNLRSPLRHQGLGSRCRPSPRLSSRVLAVARQTFGFLIRRNAHDFASVADDVGVLSQGKVRLQFGPMVIAILRNICENLAAVDAAYKARLGCDNYGS
jgi:hypothetical protein